MTTETLIQVRGLEKVFAGNHIKALNGVSADIHRGEVVVVMEEERRLCFVAMTRAQKALYLSEAEGRNLDGSPRYPSRFLLDIDDSLLQFTHTPREDLIRQAREYIGFSTRLLDESSLPQGFAPGTRVRHAVFGPGTVLELDPAQRAQLVQFDSMPTPRLLSLRTKLERI